MSLVFALVPLEISETKTDTVTVSVREWKIDREKIGFGRKKAGQLAKVSSQKIFNDNALMCNELLDVLVSSERLEQLAKEVKIDLDEFTEQTKKALTRQNMRDLAFEYQVSTQEQAVWMALGGRSTMEGWGMGGHGGSPKTNSFPEQNSLCQLLIVVFFVN